MTTIAAKAATLLATVIVTSAGWAVVGTGTASAAGGTCDTTYQVKAHGGSTQVPTNTPWEVANCTLREGNSGSGVKALQSALNLCHGAALSLDGQFGSKTRSALVAAQRSIGASADGIFGPDTRSRMKWMFTNRGGCHRL